MTTLLHSLTTTNISLYTLPAAYFLCLAPHLFAINTYDSLCNKTSLPERKFDQCAPRSFFTKLADHPSLTDSQRGMLFRAESASLNGYEGLGFFCASVVAGNLGLVVSGGNKADVKMLNILSLGYVALRMVYCVAYTKGVSGYQRGFYHWTGVLFGYAMCFKAAGTLMGS
ncbi:hypothetical protein ABW20_dc0108654 [Dactylellina cionopaga]|nr:hypothetical protein ABW20_dc0108654 [Dactylellina cionopaga]